MPKKQEIEQLHREIKPSLNTLENVASNLNQNGNRLAMRVLEALGEIETVFNKAKREADHQK